jgi:uncharacterized repeat protein (TIGR01451 family)
MRRLRVLLAGLVALVASGGATGSASAQQPPGPDGSGTDRFVTIAARQCPTYTDITANRARNNIQESLRDLGPDTPYASGQAVDAATEETVQPNCTPITSWRFTLGTGIAGQKVTGPWGSLSVVSGAYPTDVTTLASVPERDDAGRPLAGREVAGATTIELTSAQADQSGRGSLWIQGGTTTDPVLAGVPAFANGYAFGALRCATDNVNGDNVEYIAFPAGRRHVFCFAYYVVPPPTSGTIVVRKEVSTPAAADQTFTFEGNISYTADHRFDLTVKKGAPAAATFYRAETRAGDPPWTVREIVPAGWRLTGLACTGGGSDVTADPTAGTVSIRLLAGDTVICTFTDALRPAPGELLITKVTGGGVGTFEFGVRPAGGGDVVRSTATTREPGVAVPAVPGPLSLDPGSYVVGEGRPDARGGRWVQTGANCNARARRGPGPVTVTIASGRGAVCVFQNRFLPSGSIAIAKETRGGAGTTGFVIAPLAQPARQYVQSATTAAPGDLALARGDSTRRLPLGRYAIQETGTVPEEDGRWTLVSVDCGGRLLGFAQGRVVVELTRERPRVRCRFANRLVAAPAPEPEPSPSPEPSPAPEPEPPAPRPPAALAELVVTKQALRPRVRVGDVAAFRITVRNTGAAAAEQVVVADAFGAGGQLLAAQPSQGSCGQRIPLVCRLGSLAAGAEATIRVRVRAVDTPAIRNVAVAGSAAQEGSLADNAARARIRVLPRRARPGDPCARVALRAARSC